MLGAGLDMTPSDARYAEFYERYLRFYTDALCVHTTVFPGIDALVSKLEAHDIRWGIITNKTQRFTLPLLEQLGYAKRADCIVSGDSSPRAKPAPHPMLLACKLIACPPAHCLYFGDDLRDIQAGRAAGMPTVAVRYGYLGCPEPIESWGADHLVDHADDIAALVGLT
jgi:phosphoglycolate phosphatase